MANQTIPNLPGVPGLSTSALFWINQGGIDYQTSAGAIAGLSSVVATGFLTPEDFGATGGLDDTLAINAWIAALNASDGYVAACHPGRTYIFSGGLILTASGFTILGNGATLKVKNSTVVDSSHAGLQFISASNFLVADLIVDANRANRTPSVSHNAETWGIYSCNNGRFIQCGGLDAVIDNWYIAALTNSSVASFPTDCTFDQCWGINAYRNNMSITNSNRCRVLGGHYDNANGSSPQNGIDIEPNSGSATPGHIDLIVTGGVCTGNAGVGLTTAAGFGGPFEIFIDKWACDGTGAGNASAPFLFEGNSRIGSVTGRNYANAGSTNALAAYFSGNSLVNCADLRLENCTGFTNLVYVDAGSGGHVNATLNTSSASVAGVQILGGNMTVGVEALSTSVTGTSSGEALLALTGPDNIGRIQAGNCTGQGVYLGDGSRLAEWDFYGQTWGNTTGNVLVFMHGYRNSIGPGAVTAPNPQSGAVVFSGTNGGNYSLCYVSDDLRIQGLNTGQINADGSLPLEVETTANVTLTSVTKNVLVEGAAGNITVTLPATASCTPAQKLLTIRNDSANTTTLAVQGDTFKGNTTITGNTTGLLALDATQLYWNRVL